MIILIVEWDFKFISSLSRLSSLYEYCAYAQDIMEAWAGSNASLNIARDRVFKIVQNASNFKTR